MGHGFCQRHSGQRLLPGPNPVRDGALVQRGLGEVMGQHLWLGGNNAGKFLLQYVCNPGVQLQAFALQQRLIGGVFDQSVLEQVGRVRCDSSTEDQLVEPTSFSIPSVNCGSASGDTIASSSWLNSRPITAPIWASSFTGNSRSRRAINESRNVAGIAIPSHRCGIFIAVAGQDHEIQFQDRLGQLFKEERVTPSVLSTISVTRSPGSGLPPGTCMTSVALCTRLSRLRAT